MNAYAQHNVGFYSRRTMSFFFVAGAHVAVFAALMITVSTTKVDRPVPPFHATIIPKERPIETGPTSPPLDNAINTHVPIPETPIVRDDAGDTIVGDTLPPLTNEQPPQAPAHAATRAQGGTGAGFPDPAGFYPEQSIRLGDQGVSVVKVCVSSTGRLTSDPVTAKSSGFERLDMAALKLAKAGSGHYRPSTEDGVPVDSCYPVGVRFQLRN